MNFLNSLRINTSTIHSSKLHLLYHRLMKSAVGRVLMAMLAFGASHPLATAQQTQYSHGDPTALEQQMLELINRARMNPTQEGVILDGVNTWYSRDARIRKPSFFANLRSEFASYPAVPPLAFHPKLIQSSRTHSQDMITRNFFAHVNPSGLDPTARAAVIGYDSGVGENIDGAGASNGDEVVQAHFGFMVDYDNIDTSHPLGHRLNVLDAGYSEAGVGIVGPYSAGRITQDFGAPARAYIVGVAYTDTNGNGAYDPGEGLAGITVKPDTGNWYAVTSSSGGFAIPIDPVQRVTDNVSLPFAVRGGSWQTVQPYDLAYRQQQMQAAPTMQVNLTWSGGSLTSPRTSSATIKRPVQRNYRLTGTDGWYYTQNMVTTQNVKADLKSLDGIPIPLTPAASEAIPGCNATFSWSSPEPWMHVWAQSSGGGAPTSKWIQANAISLTLPAGTITWYLQSWSTGHGYSAWAGPFTFQLTGPGLPALTSPTVGSSVSVSGALHLTWDNASEWTEVWTSSSSGIADRWVQNKSYYDAVLGTGSVTVWLRNWSSAGGYGQWAGPWQFNRR